MPFTGCDPASTGTVVTLSDSESISATSSTSSPTDPRTNTRKHRKLTDLFKRLTNRYSRSSRAHFKSSFWDSRGRDSTTAIASTQSPSQTQTGTGSATRDGNAGISTQTGSADRSEDGPTTGTAPSSPPSLSATASDRVEVETSTNRFSRLTNLDGTAPTTTGRLRALRDRHFHWGKKGDSRFTTTLPAPKLSVSEVTEVTTEPSTLPANMELATAVFTLANAGLSVASWAFTNGISAMSYGASKVYSAYEWYNQPSTNAGSSVNSETITRNLVGSFPDSTAASDLPATAPLNSQNTQTETQTSRRSSVVEFAQDSSVISTAGTASTASASTPTAAMVPRKSAMRKR